MNFLNFKNLKLNSFKIFLIFILITNIWNLKEIFFFENGLIKKCEKINENNNKIIIKKKGKFTLIDYYNHFHSDQYIKSECDNCNNLNCLKDLNSKIDNFTLFIKSIILNILSFYKKETFLLYFIHDRFLFFNFFNIIVTFYSKKYSYIFYEIIGIIKLILSIYFFINILKKN